ncbi:MAG: saccharopine dehydrogenase NADP-binding domain-containing protein [Rhodospirillum sp.]|nr:saccharopine dehydrogenase NADP-binding domain-containing protein [Rhodospirillum sp.]MCF8489905.1 saccharopine dehydrogenase NADP-binding domain-containing protein [Rhodospirillum sp.]MCF8501800.1 saccharopine dehydrogenase NADP-binding domain-containing protein [Rhodospirillum sp.]
MMTTEAGSGEATVPPREDLFDPRPIALVGAGRLGARTAALISELTGAPLRVIDRDPIALERLRARLPKAELVTADLATPDGAAHVLEGARLVVLTAGPKAIPAVALAQATLRVGAHFLDAQFSMPLKLKGMVELSNRVAQANLTFVTDGGARPGLAALLGRWSAARMDRVERLTVALALSVGEDPSTLGMDRIREHLLLARKGNPVTLSERRWSKLQSRYFPVFRFPEPFGKRVGYPVLLGELRGLRDRLPALQDCGFYLCGFGPWADYWAAPLSQILDRVGARRLSEALLTRALTRPGSHAGILVALEAEGSREGVPAKGTLTLSHRDPGHLPAACLTACVAQILDPDADRGVMQQGLFCDPDRFLADLSTLGVAADQVWERMG